MDLMEAPTGIGKTFWYDPGTGEFQPAFVEHATRARNTTQTAWFDELFEGALQIPKKLKNSNAPPMTLLISGPPGTGKSTLALEFCYRLAISDLKLNSLYFTTEGHAPLFVEHARQFGWDPNRTIISTDENSNPKVAVRPLKRARDLRTAKMLPPHLLTPLSKAAFPGAPRDLTLIARGEFSFHAKPKRQYPDILVIDNLNSVSKSKTTWLDLSASIIAKGGPRLIVVILDARAGSERAEHWEFLADVVVRLDRDYTLRYMTQTIEVIKARYQKHVHGKHQFKIVKGGHNNGSSREGPNAAPPTHVHPAKAPDYTKGREHPYRTEGGIVIYPSMHFALSRRIGLHSQSRSKISPPFEGMNKQLNGGFQQGKCVAFVGEHGTHKSRLANLQILCTLKENKEAGAIIISLREDEMDLRTALAEQAHTLEGVRLDDYYNEGRLELCYFPPGFISPEEFFHRIQLSIARQQTRRNNGPIVLSFNSLDLLHSHFPLCAEHSIFVPALIEMLGFENVTTFVVSTSYKRGQDRYGLLSMADPILQFRRVPKTGADLGELFAASYPNVKRECLRPHDSIVELTIDRFAAGDSAGSQGYLALVSAEEANKIGLPSGLIYFALPSDIAASATPATDHLI